MRITVRQLKGLIKESIKDMLVEIQTPAEAQGGDEGEKQYAARKKAAESTAFLVKKNLDGNRFIKDAKGTLDIKVIPGGNHPRVLGAEFFTIHGEITFPSKLAIIRFDADQFFGADEPATAFAWQRTRAVLHILKGFVVDRGQNGKKEFFDNETEGGAGYKYKTDVELAEAMGDTLDSINIGLGMIVPEVLKTLAAPPDQQQKQTPATPATQQQKQIQEVWQRRGWRR